MEGAKNYNCSMACQVEEEEEEEEEGGGSLGGAKGLLGGVHHVEEAILVPLTFVDLGDGGGHRHHAVAVGQQEEGLVGVQLEAPPGGETAARQESGGEEKTGGNRKGDEMRGGERKEEENKGDRKRE